MNKVSLVFLLTRGETLNTQYYPFIVSVLKVTTMYPIM